MKKISIYSFILLVSFVLGAQGNYHYANASYNVNNH